MHDTIAISELKRILHQTEKRVSLEASIRHDGLGDMKTFDAPGPFEAELLSLAKLKHAHQFVMQLEKTMRPIIAQLSERLIKPSRQFGIDKLPDHILALIFDMALQEAVFVDDEEEDEGKPPQSYRAAARVRELLRDLALTSKRFWAIVNSTASLWAYISESYAPLQLENFLSKSRGAQLTFELDITEQAIRERQLPDFMHRCRALYLNTSYEPTTHLDGEMRNAQYLTHHSQVLPSIKTFAVRGWCSSNVFFETWEMPNLKHLYLTFALPLPSQATMLGLTTLNIRYLGLEEVTDSMPLVQLARLLLSTQALRRLAIIFDETCFVDEDGEDLKLISNSEDDRLIAIDLPHLTSLEIVSQCDDIYGSEAIHAIWRLTNQMRVPELRALKLHYTRTDEATFQDSICIPFRYQELKHLQTLSLKISLLVSQYDGDAWKDWMFITGLLVAQPSLMEVSIFSERCTKLYDYIKACPNIRLFRFEGNLLDPLSKTIEGVRGLKADLQYCDIRSPWFPGKGKEVVRFDETIGTTRWLWKDKSESDDEM